MMADLKKIKERRIKQIQKNKERRHKLRAQHRCIICGVKIKPIIVYHQFCPKHKPKKKDDVCEKEKGK